MWTQTQKDIIKGCYGQFSGSLLDFKMHGHYKEQYFDVSKPGQRVAWEEPIKMMETPNTNRTCRNCQGNKWIYVIMKGFGDLVVKRPCTNCGGTGQVHG